MVRYNYDIFGAITAVKNGSNEPITDTTSIAFLNPLRYRGYVYDDETGLYYLRSRYYDAVTGRFLNADVYVDTDTGSPLSTNMFAYCENNTLYRIDKSGQKYYPYNRYNALAYAKRFYNSYPSNFWHFDDGDCANFVSQCLFNGGVYMDYRNWYHYIERFGFMKFPIYSLSWTVVGFQYKYFRKSNYVKAVVTGITKKTSAAEYKSLIRVYGIRAGDVMYMDFDGDGILDHATMISTIRYGYSILYTAHTSFRWNYPLATSFKSNPKMKITIMVFY